MKTVHIWGCPCSIPKSEEDIRDKLLQLIASEPGYTCAINAEKLMLYSEKDKVLCKAINSASFAYPDGFGAVLAIRRIYDDNTFKVDMPRIVLELADEYRFKLFLLGATEESNLKAWKAIRSRYPDIKLVGRSNGYFSESDEVHVVSQLRETVPDIILVGMGSPRQELFSSQLIKQIDSGLIVCCGGAIDILAGIKKRAPAFFVNNGLEWAFRLFKEPQRLTRQGRLVSFLIKLIFYEGTVE